jgi:gas vesicle protein GvpN
MPRNRNIARAKAGIAERLEGGRPADEDGISAQAPGLPEAVRDAPGRTPGSKKGLADGRHGLGEEATALKMSRATVCAEGPTVLSLEPEENFIETSQVRDLTERALSYLQAGYPIHFSGLAGTGKTTLAMHVARKLSQPTMLIFGDDEFGSSNLIGGEHGYRSRRVIDRFISRVLKTEEDVSTRWVDNRLTQACREGFTLIYDEFNRSRPEANNVLLSILEERLLALPMISGEGDCLEVHPNFRAIFTSNPEEYAGVHKTQDALRDRMVTINLDHFDEETETAITEARSGIARQEAERIVRLVRDLRDLGDGRYNPTVRACVMIGKVLKTRRARAAAHDPIFRQICFDVLAGETSGPLGRKQMRQEMFAVVEDLIRTRCNQNLDCIKGNKFHGNAGKERERIQQDA